MVSETDEHGDWAIVLTVLILVLVEDGLGAIALSDKGLRAVES